VATSTFYSIDYYGTMHWEYEAEAGTDWNDAPLEWDIQLANVC